jgi:hypothetical protein
MPLAFNWYAAGGNMNDIMGRNMDRELDNYITGHYGEDQFKTRRKTSGSKRHIHQQPQHAICEFCGGTGVVELDSDHTEAPCSCVRKRPITGRQYEEYRKRKQKVVDRDNKTKYIGSV